MRYKIKNDKVEAVKQMARSLEKYERFDCKPDWFVNIETLEDVEFGKIKVLLPSGKIIYWGVDEYLVKLPDGQLVIIDSRTFEEYYIPDKSIKNISPEEQPGVPSTHEMVYELYYKMIEDGGIDYILKEIGRAVIESNDKLVMEKTVQYYTELKLKQLEARRFKNEQHT